MLSASSWVADGSNLVPNQGTLLAMVSAMPPFDKGGSGITGTARIPEV